MINPSNHAIAGGLAALASEYNETWNPGEQARQDLRDMIDTRGIAFVQVPLQNEDILPSMNWKGNQWSWVDVRDVRQNYQSVTHVIPMKWIADWFSELSWREKREAYRRGQYAAPPLGPTLVVWYERKNGRARAYYGVKDEDPYWSALQYQQADMGLYGYY